MASAVYLGDLPTDMSADELDALFPDSAKPDSIERKEGVAVKGRAIALFSSAEAAREAFVQIGDNTEAGMDPFLLADYDVIKSRTILLKELPADESHGDLRDMIQDALCEFNPSKVETRYSLLNDQNAGFGLVTCPDPFDFLGMLHTLTGTNGHSDLKKIFPNVRSLSLHDHTYLKSRMRVIKQIMSMRKMAQKKHGDSLSDEALRTILVANVPAAADTAALEGCLSAYNLEKCEVLVSNTTSSFGLAILTLANALNATEFKALTAALDGIDANTRVTCTPVAKLPPAPGDTEGKRPATGDARGADRKKRPTTEENIALRTLHSTLVPKPLTPSTPCTRRWRKAITQVIKLNRKKSNMLGMMKTRASKGTSILDRIQRLEDRIYDELVRLQQAQKANARADEASNKAIMNRMNAIQAQQSGEDKSIRNALAAAKAEHTERTTARLQVLLELLDACQTESTAVHADIELHADCKEDRPFVEWMQGDLNVHQYDRILSDLRAKKEHVQTELLLLKGDLAGEDEDMLAGAKKAQQQLDDCEERMERSTALLTKYEAAVGEGIEELRGVVTGEELLKLKEDILKQTEELQKKMEDLGHSVQDLSESKGVSQDRIQELVKELVELYIKKNDNSSSETLKSEFKSTANQLKKELDALMKSDKSDIDGRLKLKADKDELQMKADERVVRELEEMLDKLSRDSSGFRTVLQDIKEVAMNLEDRLLKQLENMTQNGGRLGGVEECAASKSLLTGEPIPSPGGLDFAHDQRQFLPKLHPNWPAEVYRGGFRMPLHSRPHALLYSSEMVDAARASLSAEPSPGGYDAHQSESVDIPMPKKNQQPQEHPIRVDPSRKGFSSKSTRILRSQESPAEALLRQPGVATYVTRKADNFSRKQLRAFGVSGNQGQGGGGNQSR